MIRRRGHQRARAGAWLAMAAVASVIVAGPIQPVRANTDTPTVYWGVATHAEGGLSDTQVRVNLEGKIGAALTPADPNFRFAIFRKYMNWTQKFPTAWQKTLWSQGIIPYTAWTTYVKGTGDLTFADVKSGAYDTYITQQAQRVANYAKKTGFHMVFTFQHEPEDGQGSGDPQAGPANDYIAAFERVHDIFQQVFDAAGVDPLTWVNTLSLGGFAGNRGDPASWFPPPSYYDYVGVDGYVRWPCVTWDRRPFLNFHDTFANAHTFANRVGKPLFIGEVGIIEQTECNNTSGDPQAKANWVLEAASQTKAWNDDPGEADVIALCWSHVIVNFLDRHKLNYHVDTTPQAWAAFIHDTNDPYFRRSGVPLP